MSSLWGGGGSGEETGCTIEGSGTPKAVIKAVERIANPRGRMKHSHLPERLADENRAAPGGQHLQKLEASRQFFQGFCKPGLKKEGVAGAPCPIPGTPSAELSDLCTLYFPWA